ncbi:hypothetical protein DFQ26_008432 [Actinomortierella ambigua]|nr:hypothetical protein DFQ26_008432 [Actinomortierella ambigua]
MLATPSAAVSAVVASSSTCRALALPELLFAVLDTLAAQADQDPVLTQAALRACTLVNRTWYLHANPFMYRAPFLAQCGGRHHSKATKALIRTLTTTSHGAHVRSLARVPSETWELFSSLKDCFTPCPRLSTLTLCFRAGEQGHWMEPFLKENYGELDPVVRAGMSRVTELDLTSVGVKDGADKDDLTYAEASLNCIAACTRLQKLTTTQADWSQVTELPKTLVDLSISFLYPPSLMSTVALAPFLEGLTRLHVHYTPKAEPPQAFMAVVAHACKQLVHLDVCAESITCASLRTLVANNRDLVTIYLRNCPDEYTKAVLDNSPKKLEVLDMGTVDAKLVLKALEVCPRLVSIGKTIARHATAASNNADYWRQFLDNATQLQELHVERWSDFHNKDLLFNTVLPRLGPKLVNVWFGWRDLLGCEDLDKVLVHCKKLEVLRAPVKGNSQNLIRTFKKHGPASRLREVRLICDNFKLVEDDKRRMYRLMPHLAQFAA